MLDEEVIPFDYIPFLLDNLTRLNKDIEIELRIESVTLSKPSPGGLNTFHFAVFVQARGAATADVVFQASYLAPGSSRIKKPYVEYDNLLNFLKFIENVFSPSQVRGILRKVILVKKSQLKEEEINIPRIQTWNSPYL